jgi:hypothetical protein
LDQTGDLEIQNLFRFPEHGMHLALLLVFSISYRPRFLSAFIFGFFHPCSFIVPCCIGGNPRFVFYATRGVQV